MSPAEKQRRGKAATTAQGGDAPPVKKRTRKERSAENKRRYNEDRVAFHRAVTEELAATVGPLTPKAKAPGSKLAPYVHPKDVIWTEELGAELFKLVATGHLLDDIAQVDGMPPLFTMLTWLHTKDHPFIKLYQDAKDALIPLVEERAVAAAVRPLLGEIRTSKEVLDREGAIKTLEETRTSDSVERSRLMTDAYRWWLAVRRPKVYGRNAEPPGEGNDSLKELLGAFRARNAALESGGE